MSEKENKDKRVSRRRLYIIIALIIIIILLLLRSCTGPKQKGTSNKPLDIDPNQHEVVDKPETKEEKKEEGKIYLPGWGTLNIAKDSTHITKGINFKNPDKNVWFICPECGSILDKEMKCPKDDSSWTKETAEKHLYYMTFSLYLKENNELLYQSGLVEPGKRITEIDLSRPLEKGVYEAYVFIQPYKDDKITKTNSGKVELKLNVN